MALVGAEEVLATDSAAVVAELRRNLAAYCDADEAPISTSTRGLRQKLVSESLVPELGHHCRLIRFSLAASLLRALPLFERSRTARVSTRDRRC